MSPNSDFPRIGIPCQYNDETNALYRVPLVSQNASYVSSVIRAGGAPVLIPPTMSDDMLRVVYETLHGVLLAGGVDVDPDLYGEIAHNKLGRLDRDRDRTEVTLTRWAFEDGLPMLGICRGLQVLNVALGGTLYQDIASQLGTTINHSRVDVTRDTLGHSVRIETGSRLAKIIGRSELDVNSLHHQAIKSLAKSLQAVAWAPDGVIEGAERQEAAFCVAVQWHPEEFPVRSPHRSLFVSLVEAARERA